MRQTSDRQAAPFVTLIPPYSEEEGAWHMLEADAETDI